MRPSYRLLQLLAVLALLALLLSGLRLSGITSPELLLLIQELFWISAGLSVIVAGLDLLCRPPAACIEVTRQLSESVALGVSSQVQLTLRNPFTYPVQLTVQEQHPEAIDCIGLPVDLKLAADSRKALSYSIVPLRRGDADFGPCLLRVDSHWGLWQTVVAVGDAAAIRVYPNFAPIARLAHLGIEQSINQLGIHQIQRRGEGLDFQQLREFREGDALRQIDWKATARQRKPISRDYQDERDQDVIFLLDCGRRLRAKDDTLSHFDHALNALLLTTYIALRQGDGVGLVSFAGAPRWVSPVKGQASINTFLNQLYDLHSSTESNDYLQAAQQLIARHSKRALIVIITNVRDEDGEDLIDATRLLRKKHRVLIANLRETFLDEVVDKKVANFTDAMTYCGSLQYLQQRQHLLKKLLSTGVVVVDSTPQQLHINLVKEYLALKRSGRI